MEIINGDEFPPLAYDEVKRKALHHQSLLRDIRIKVNEIDLDNFDVMEVKAFIEFVKKKTD